jgi:hypothetical protein
MARANTAGGELGEVGERFGRRRRALGVDHGSDSRHAAGGNVGRNGRPGAGFPALPRRRCDRTRTIATNGSRQPVVIATAAAAGAHGHDVVGGGTEGVLDLLTLSGGSTNAAVRRDGSVGRSRGALAGDPRARLPAPGAAGVEHAPSGPAARPGLVGGRDRPIGLRSATPSSHGADAQQQGPPACEGGWSPPWRASAVAGTRRSGSGKQTAVALGRRRA